MLCTCPNCDTMVPIDQELLARGESMIMKCICCALHFDPFDKKDFEATLRLAALREQMVVDNNLKNNFRHFEDC